VTETPATTPPPAPVFPPGRYGRRRAANRRRPWLVAVLAAAALALGGLVAWRLYATYGDPMYKAQVVTYTNLSDTRASITFRVHVPAGGAALCQVRARARDGAEVGHAEVRVDAAAGETRPTVTTELATTARAMVGEVLRCRAA
jgi:hypothetical protein